MPQLPPIPALHHPGSSPSLAPAHLSDKGRPTFGVNLADQMARDDVDIPPIVTKCCEVIERYGLDQQGIYRVGGTHSKVMKLKERLDRGASSSATSDLPCPCSRSGTPRGRDVRPVGDSPASASRPQRFPQIFCGRWLGQSGDDADPPHQISTR